MANNCVCKLEILGVNNTEKYQEFKQFLNKCEKYNHRGHLPEIVLSTLDTSKDYIHYFFDVSFDDEGIADFWTKWSPPIKELEIISNHYELSLKVTFEEGGNGIWGKAEAHPGEGIMEYYVPEDKLQELYTKFTYTGRDGFEHTNYDGLESAIHRIIKEADYED